MFDIVICSSSRDLMNRSIKVVNEVLFGYEFDYHIDKFMRSSTRLMNLISDGKKRIYIIDTNMLDIAYKIREDDYVSIIILISRQNMIDIGLFHDKLLVLDYIYYDDNYENNLIKDMNMSLKIIFRDNVFSFKYNYMVYRISYKHINYIEKEPNVKRCIIHTLDDEYYVVNSIEKIINSLDGMFIKSSQSCIINMMNVKYIDCASNMVHFKNGDSTGMVTDKIKKIIKEYIE